jgi:hypothetical protein
LERPQPAGYATLDIPTLIELLQSLLDFAVAQVDCDRPYQYAGSLEVD